MAKIDTSRINGYDAMSTEEKLAALEAFEMEDNSASELERYKNAVTKANAEAADYKKQLRAKQTEQEQAEADRKKEWDDITAELNQLRKEKTVSNYKAEYLKLGYDEKMADDTAMALAEGKTDVVFANQKAFLESQKKAMEAAALNQQPTVTSGMPLASQDVQKSEMDQLRRWAGLK